MVALISGTKLMLRLPQPFFAWRVWKITEGFKIKRAFLLRMIIVVLSATQFGELSVRLYSICTE